MAFSFLIPTFSSRPPQAIPRTHARASAAGPTISPVRLLSAVIEHSRDTGEDPEVLLDAVFPLVCQFKALRILMHPEDVRPLPTEPKFKAGAVVAGCRVLRCIAAQSETEIYQVETWTGSLAALKWVPFHAPTFVKIGLTREQDFLNSLEQKGVRSVPRVISAGSDADSGLFLLLSWCEGRTLYQLAQRDDLNMGTRCDIAVRLTAIYAELHSHGLLHGDVHPGNVLGDRGRDPVVLDFGAARWIDGGADRPRAGLLTDYEPEAARELLEHNSLPPATPLGEQYCVAALIFRLITRTACLRLSLEGQTALRQIVEQEPKGFAEVGVLGPAVEAVLRRGLAKEPSLRFATMADFHAALQSAVDVELPVAESQVGSGPGLRIREQDVFQGMLDVYGADSGLLDVGLGLGPTASLYYGAAGIAYALLRAAILKEHAGALAAADVWIERAVLQMPEAHAFDGPEIGIHTADLGPAAFFHMASGVDAVRAMVRQACGDSDGAAKSIRAYLAGLPCSSASAPKRVTSTRFALDLMNGAAGHLLGVCLLYEVCTDLEPLLGATLVGEGDRLMDLVAANVAAFPDADVGTGTKYVGMAHGLAGALFAICRWVDARALRLPDAVSAALDRQAMMAVAGPGWQGWPVETGSRRSAPWTGWCHGSAGHVLLWSLASRVRDCNDDRDRVIGAGRHLWAHREHSNTSLCCGLAGEALSLCEVARVSGDSVWFDRAGALLDQAALSGHEPLAPHSLFRGHIGVMFARLELEHAQDAAFPLFKPPTIAL